MSSALVPDLRASLLGVWSASQSVSTYVGGGDGGCYSVHKTFTFAAEFQADGTLRGSIKDSYMDDGLELGGSKPFTGTWTLDAQTSRICTHVDQTCMKDDQLEMQSEELPIVQISCTYQEGQVSAVTIDASQSAIDHEDHVDDVLVLTCSKQM
jgi:hypothetical protein